MNRNQMLGDEIPEAQSYSATDGISHEPFYVDCLPRFMTNHLTLLPVIGTIFIIQLIRSTGTGQIIDRPITAPFHFVNICFGYQCWKCPWQGDTPRATGCCSLYQPDTQQTEQLLLKQWSFKRPPGITCNSTSAQTNIQASKTNTAVARWKNGQAPASNPGSSLIIEN